MANWARDHREAVERHFKHITGPNIKDDVAEMLAVQSISMTGNRVFDAVLKIPEQAIGLGARGIRMLLDLRKGAAK